MKLLFSMPFWLFLLVHPLCAEDRGMENLDSLQWKNRILIVRAPVAGSDAEKTLRAAATEISERHLVWFLITAEGMTSNYTGAIAGGFREMLLQRYFTDGATNVVLIGKDGGVKAREASLDLEAIFKRIDSMPMRQEEMRRQ
ncbi:DUF4174 domain-containing protein [Microbulbifer guangxiensis]|uniref:DUF4174 domain-containing protein n=1 Tax=Microbulbifer guangxiensis TaxID=2904249 RepID=UPI001F1FC3DA|nr:DUF4174 domain-containing protein [Microbulbifer guangxiensis]